MSFTISTQPFGTFTEYVLQNPATGEGFTVIPQHGGIVRRLVLRKPNSPVNAEDENSGLISLLKVADSPQALAADETYASALLFPFPSRIKYGIYAFAGNEYTLPFNDFGRDNSIHGFVHPEAFAVIGQEASETSAALTVAYDYGGTMKGYPFPFRLEVCYTLTETHGTSAVLTVRYNATNTGINRCPMAFGWHPYFTLNSEDIDTLAIELPTQTAIVLDTDLLPVGREPFDATGPISLHDRQFDNAFLVNEHVQGAETILRSASQGVALHVWQDSSFPYLVVYTPGRRDNIAIEALTANVDSFNNGEGLMILEPGQSMAGIIKVWID